MFREREQTINGQLSYLLYFVLMWVWSQVDAAAEADAVREQQLKQTQSGSSSCLQLQSGFSESVSETKEHPLLSLCHCTLLPHSFALQVATALNVVSLWLRNCTHSFFSAIPINQNVLLICLIRDPISTCKSKVSKVHVALWYTVSMIVQALCCHDSCMDSSDQLQLVLFHLQVHLFNTTILYLQFDGVHIVSGSLDTSIRVWNAETGQCIHTLTGQWTRLLMILCCYYGDQTTPTHCTGHQSLTSGMELKKNVLVSGNADSTVKVHKLYIIQQQFRQEL